MTTEITMTALFDMQLTSETLASEEIAEITGATRKADQIKWLDKNGWAYVKNKAGMPIVGRMFARLKLSGINPKSLTQGGWQPDFSGIK
jgi:hypothetical protein